MGQSTWSSLWAPAQPWAVGPANRYYGVDLPERNRAALAAPHPPRNPLLLKDYLVILPP